MNRTDKATEAHRVSLQSRPYGEGVGGQIRRRREHLNMSLEQVAQRSGMTRAALSLIERGGNPRLDSLTLIAGALRCTVADLVAGPESIVVRLKIDTQDELLRAEARSGGHESVSVMLAKRGETSREALAGMLEYMAAFRADLSASDGRK